MAAKIESKKEKKKTVVVVVVTKNPRNGWTD